MIFNCKKCKGVFNCDKHDIYTSTCTCNSTYKFYRTPEFLKWLDIWDEECKNWVIYKNSFYRFFSQSAIRVFPELTRLLLKKKFWNWVAGMAVLLITIFLGIIMVLILTISLCNISKSTILQQNCFNLLLILFPLMIIPFQKLYVSTH